MKKRNTRAEQALIAEIEKRMNIFTEDIFNIETKMDTLKKVT